MATLALSVAGQFAGGLIGGPIGATLGPGAGGAGGERHRQCAVRRQAGAGRADGQRHPAAGLDAKAGRSRASTAGAASPATSSGRRNWRKRRSNPPAPRAPAPSDDHHHDPRQLRGRAVRGRGGRLGRDLGGRRAARDRRDQLPVLSRQRDAGGRQPDRGQAGRGDAPAYRGLCYLVFERLDLTPFGNRIPNLSVELCRVVGGPRAGDHGGDGDPRRDRVRLRPGAAGAAGVAGRDGERERARLSARLGLDGVARRIAGAVPEPPACVAGGGVVRRRPALRQLHGGAAGRERRAGSGRRRAGRWRGWRAATRGVVSSVDGGAGLWRHAVGRGGAGGDRRPQGARARRDALPDAPDGHCGRQRAGRSL